MKLYDSIAKVILLTNLTKDMWLKWINTSEVNRETGNPVYRFQTGNRFAKRITGYRILVIDFWRLATHS